MFELSIKVSSIEEAERILACLRHDAAPTVVEQVGRQLEFHDPAGLSDAESPAAKHFPGVTNAAIEPAQEPKKPRGRPRREVAPPLPESAAPVASLPEKQGPAPAPESEPKVEGQAAQQTLTLDDAKHALMDVQARHGTADMAVPLALLAQFNAARVSEIKPADYVAFVAACKAA